MWLEGQQDAAKVTFKGSWWLILYINDPYENSEKRLRATRSTSNTLWQLRHSPRSIKLTSKSTGCTANWLIDGSGISPMRWRWKLPFSPTMEPIDEEPTAIVSKLVTHSSGRLYTVWDGFDMAFELSSRHWQKNKVGCQEVLYATCKSRSLDCTSCYSPLHAGTW